MKNKIIKTIERIYNNTNFFYVSVIFLLLFISLFLYSLLIFVSIEMQNNYLVVYTEENMKNLSIPPLREEQISNIQTDTTEISTTYFLICVIFFANRNIQIY